LGLQGEERPQVFALGEPAEPGAGAGGLRAVQVHQVALLLHGGPGGQPQPQAPFAGGAGPVGRRVPGGRAPAGVRAGHHAAAGAALAAGGRPLVGFGWWWGTGGRRGWLLLRLRLGVAAGLLGAYLLWHGPGPPTRSWASGGGVFTALRRPLVTSTHPHLAA